MRGRIFPYAGAIAVLLRLYSNVVEDVEKVYEVDEYVKPFIFSAIVSVLVTFSSFTFVQQVTQWRAPKEFWRSELYYGVLSLISKGILGTILLANLVGRNIREESV